MNAPTVTPERHAEFAAVAAEARRLRPQSARPARLQAAREVRSFQPGEAEAPSVRGSGTPGGRVPSDLTSDEVRELDVIAQADERQWERRAQRAADLSAVHDYAIEFGRRVQAHERALVASMGGGRQVQHWEGPIGYEGTPTGDGRLIAAGALTASDYPLPLRWAPVDFGAHDGAVVVGRIDSIERRPDGTIFARGVLDLGSELGREAARLIRAGMLGGVSVDLDATTTALSIEPGQRASVVSEGRVRAATLVAIPAFHDARIALVDAPPRLLPYAGPHDPTDCDCEEPLADADVDCGCDEPGPGVHTFPALDDFPTIYDLPTIDDMKTLAVRARAARTKETG